MVIFYNKGIYTLVFAKTPISLQKYKNTRVKMSSEKIITHLIKFGGGIMKNTIVEALYVDGKFITIGLPESKEFYVWMWQRKNPSSIVEIRKIDNEDLKYEYNRIKRRNENYIFTYDRAYNENLSGIIGVATQQYQQYWKGFTDMRCIY